MAEPEHDGRRDQDVHVAVVELERDEGEREGHRTQPGLPAIQTTVATRTCVHDHENTHQSTKLNQSKTSATGGA